MLGQQELLQQHLQFVQFSQHPGEKFDISPFVDSCCKTPVEEIQTAIDGAISKEQAVKLRQCLDHIDELQKRNTSAPGLDVVLIMIKVTAKLSLLRFPVLLFILN